MGSAGFPTAVKYETDKAIHWSAGQRLRMRAVSPVDHQLMVRHADQLVADAVARSDRRPAQR